MLILLNEYESAPDLRPSGADVPAAISGQTVPIITIPSGFLKLRTPWSTVGVGKNRQAMILLPKLSLRLVQWSFAKRYLMNEIFGFAWAVAVPSGDDRVMG